MNIDDTLFQIGDKIFDEEFFGIIFKRYQNESTGEVFIAEQEYTQAKEMLFRFLAESQIISLKEAEELCWENARWLMRFGVKRGIFAGFNQYFSPGVSGQTFQTLVYEQVMRMPNMTRYCGYYERRVKANQLFDLIRNTRGKRINEFISNIEATWQTRFYGILRHSFYVGYRGAILLIDNVQPERGSLSMIEKILLTEYKLGMIRLSHERELQKKL